MEDRVKPLMAVEPGLRPGALAVERAEGAGEAAKGDGRGAIAGERGEIGEGPDGADEAALARVIAVHRLAHIVRIGLRRGAIGIEAHADGAGTYGERLLPDEGAHALGHCR